MTEAARIKQIFLPCLSSYPPNSNDPNATAKNAVVPISPIAKGFAQIRSSSVVQFLRDRDQSTLNSDVISGLQAIS